MGLTALWGANGAIGRSIADAFRSEGRPYRVVGRTRESLERSFGHDPLAEIATWDPADPASVRAAAEGVETIVYLVGVDYTKFALHPKLMRATLDGAIAAGVRRMLLIGTVYPYGRTGSTPVREDHPRAPQTFKGRMRLEQEELLLAADRAGTIAGAVLRLPDFYGPGVDKSIVGELFTKGAAGERASLIGPTDVPHQFIYAPDVGPVVVRLVDDAGAFGRVWHLAGPGLITQREMTALVERAVGRRVKTMVAGKTMLRLLGLGIPMMRELAEMNYLISDPVILDDSALRERLGPIHKTPYEIGVPASIAARARP